MTKNQQDTRIVIASGDLTMAAELEPRLEGLGYSVLSIVGSGEELLEAADRDPPDLILMDPALTGELDSHDTARIIRRRHDLPVIFTAVNDEDDNLSMLKGVELFGNVLRPFRDRELEVTIEMALYASHLEAERRLAQEALRENEKRFRLLYEQAPLGYQLLDDNCRIIEVNQAWLDSLGYSRKEVIGKPFLDLVSDEYRHFFHDYFLKERDRGQVEGIEFEMVGKDGSTSFMSLSGRATRDERGAYRGMHCIISDITKRKALEEQWRKFEFIIDSSTDFMSLINRNYEYEIVNHAYRNTLEPSQRDVEGRPLALVWGDEIFEKQIRQNLEKCFLGQTVRHEDWFDFHDRGRGYYEVTFTPFYNENGDVTYAIVVSHDITDRRLARDAEIQAREEWERTFNSVSDLIFIIDKKYKITRINKAVSDKLNLDASQVIGRQCYEIIHDSDRPPEWCPHAETLQDGMEHSVESHEEHLAGDFLISASPLRSSDGDLIGSVHIVRDITRRKANEKERERLIGELQEALAEVKTLRGFLPICSNCNKIRDDDGYWQRLEKYIMDRSDAKFSHGICPDCARELYPHLFKDK